jgi:hypothetical protein
MGSMLGTPQFMSPEQAEGRLDKTGPAADIYSLGATLYFLLTGQSPFEGGDVHETLARVRCGDFPRPRHVRRDVPAALEAICLKAMSLDPAHRYTSASNLAEDVDAWLADEPVAAYREPWRQRLARWSRRHRAWTQAGALAVISVAITATLATILVAQAWRQEDLEHEQTMQARREAEAARRVAEEAHRELARQLRLRDLDERQP